MIDIDFVDIMREQFDCECFAIIGYKKNGDTIRIGNGNTIPLIGIMEVWQRKLVIDQLQSKEKKK